MKKIFFLMQLPPPVHGASVINTRVASIVNSDSYFLSKIFRLNYASNFEEMHASFFVKFKYSVSLVLSLFYSYIKLKPNVTYISFSPFGFGFYRDFFFVVLAKLFNSRTVLHLHGTGLTKATGVFKAKLLQWMFKKSKLIVISKSLAEDVRAFIDNSGVVIIDNCVDDPGLVGKSNSGGLNVLYLANLDVRKGVKIAVEAFVQLHQKIPDARLRIAGSDTSLLTRKKLQIYIEETFPEVTHAIELIGPVYGEEKNLVFRQSDLFIYPSMHDAAPLVVLEALSYGLPVVCSTQGALPDMITPGVNGYICASNSASEYAQLVISCLNDMPKFAAQARNSYLERYSPDVFDKKIVKVLLEG
jgi:glycosyltransferase involved in cell wall biosynthesis